MKTILLIVFVLVGFATGSSPSAQRVRLNAPLARVAAGQVLDARASADGSFLVYAADPLADGVVRLVRAPLFVPGASLDLGVELNGQPSFELAADGAHVVFLARDEAGAAVLGSVPSDGSAVAVALAPASAEVSRFQITADGRRVVYLARLASSVRDELFSAAIEGGVAHKISAALAAGSVLDFALAPDSESVFFRANPTSPATIDLFRGSASGRSPARRLTAHATDRVVREYAVSAPGGVAAEVVYRADSLANDHYELFAVAARGSTPRRLSQELPRQGDVTRFRLSADGQRAVYLASTEHVTQFELFSVALAPGAAPLRLDSASVATDSVTGFELDARGRRVVFTMKQRYPAPTLLFGAPLDASAPAVRLDLDDRPTLDVLEVHLAPDGEHLVYTKDPQQRRIYGVRSDGATPPVLIAPSLSGQFLGFGADGARAVFGVTSVSVDGSGAPQSLAPGGEPLRIAGDTLLYRVATFAPSSSPLARTDLFRVPIDGGAAPEQINAPFPLGPIGDDVLHFALAGAANRAVYTTAFGALFGVGTNSGGQAVRLDDPSAGFLSGGPPLVTPDGRSVVFVQGDRTWVAALDGSRAPEVLVASASFGELTPDGTRYVFTVPVGSQWGLASVPVDRSSAPVILTDDALGDLLFTPDSARVVFTHWDGRLASAPCDGSAPEADLELAPRERTPALSPDGRYVVCTGWTGDTNLKLLAVPVDGSRAPVVLDDLARSSYLYFHDLVIEPSSSFVVYSFLRDGDGVLLRVTIDGTAPPKVLLQEPGGLMGAPLLAPDGRRAVVASNVELEPFGGGGYEGGGGSYVHCDIVSVPLDGSGQIVALNAGRVGPGTEGVSRHGVMYVQLPVFMSPNGDAVFAEGAQLVSAAVDGSARAELGIQAAGTALDVEFTPDGRSALFLQPIGDGKGLYAVALDGRRRMRLVSGAPAPSGSIEPSCFSYDGCPPFRIAGDGSRVLYRGDLDEDGVYELFLSPLLENVRRAR